METGSPGCAATREVPGPAEHTLRCMSGTWETNPAYSLKKHWKVNENLVKTAAAGCRWRAGGSKPSLRTF